MNQLGDNHEARVIKIINLLKEHTLSMDRPALLQISDEFGKDPFLILICCLLSLRARDVEVIPVCQSLFRVAKTPAQLLSLDQGDLEKMLHSLGFYRSKARALKSVSSELIERFDSKVPADEADLLSIKGIGRKTANAVLGYAFDIPAICVDTHVHRIVNRLGWMKTKTAKQTEEQLRLLVPQKYWIELNSLFVMWGQNVCTPVSPFCSRCALLPYCPRIGVTKSR